MADEELQEPSAPLALGPGDDDPRSPVRGEPAVIAGPLRPGDDDHRSPVVGTPSTTASPPFPGELVGEDTTAGVVILAPEPPAPGAVPIMRSIVRIPVPAAIPADE